MEESDPDVTSEPGSRCTNLDHLLEAQARYQRRAGALLRGVEYTSSSSSGPESSGGPSSAASLATRRHSNQWSRHSNELSRLSNHMSRHSNEIIRPTPHVYEFGYPPDNKESKSRPRLKIKDSHSEEIEELPEIPSTFDSLKRKRRMALTVPDAVSASNVKMRMSAPEPKPETPEPSSCHVTIEPNKSQGRESPRLRQDSEDILRTAAATQRVNLGARGRRLTNTSVSFQPDTPNLERQGSNHANSLKVGSYTSQRRKSAVASFVFNMRYMDDGSPVLKTSDLYADDNLYGQEQTDGYEERSASRQARQNTDNARAGYGCCRLLLHDMRTWWRRRQHRQEDNPILHEHISVIEGQFGSGIVSFFIYLRWVLQLNLGLGLLWGLLAVLPQALHFSYSEVVPDFYVLDLVTGEHAVGQSWVFYGQYEKSLGSYPLALLYLICILVTYFGALFFVLHSLALSLQDEGGSMGTPQYQFSFLVLQSWDYSLNSREASHNLSMGIANSFKDIMHELKVQETLETRSRGVWIKLFIRRWIAWAITLISIIGGLFIIFYTISQDFGELIREMGYDVSDESVVVTYGPSLIFVMVNAAIPEILYQLPLLEKYASGRKEMYIDIGRVFFFRTVNIMALVFSLYLKIEKGRFSGCAGTLIGQELYKLVIIDTILGIITVLTPNYFFYYWSGKKQEFSMAPQVLKILYRQAIVWLGTLVCPLLPLIGAASTYIFFMSCKLSVQATCKPPEKRWNQPRRSLFFMSLTATTLVCLIIVVSIIIGRDDLVMLGEIGGNSTQLCGPFGNGTMLAAFTEWQERLTEQSSILSGLLDVFLSSTFVTPLVFVLLAVLYFQGLSLSWERDRINMLNIELAEEREMSRHWMRKSYRF